MQGKETFDLTSEYKFMEHFTRRNCKLLRDHSSPNHFCYLETLRLEKKLCKTFTSI